METLCNFDKIVSIKIYDFEELDLEYRPPMEGGWLTSDIEGGWFESKGKELDTRVYTTEDVSQYDHLYTSNNSLYERPRIKISFTDGSSTTRYFDSIDSARKNARYIIEMSNCNFDVL